MDQNTNAVAVEQQESIDRAYRLSSGSNIGEEGMKKMQQDTHETLSTVSSESQETAESSAIHNAQGYPAYETDPTSKASDVLDKSDQKPLDSDPSDRADCGSDFVRSETGSSSSSVDSRKSLPVPTIDESVEGAGSHIHNQGINSTELNIDLGDVNETQPVFERVERMSDILVAFENNELPQPSSFDSPFSVHVVPNTLDVEQQHKAEKIKNDMKACTRTLVVVVLILASGLVLYGPISTK
ncbi:hypothetical protein ABVK25_008130 [Lepraria finkii]|uniref:Uncharacterized protein n=1 Tax=Lepraria finkii TaxID=1340010 RepID=A0ABR4B1C8_9LECA